MTKIMPVRSLFSLSLFLMISIEAAFPQSLNLPERGPGSLNGGAIVEAITPLSREAREERLFQEITSGNIPDFLRTLVPVTSSGVVAGTTKVVTYFVTPDYIAVGADVDYFLSPMTPLLAQRLADTLRCILPSRKMVNDVYSAAPLKLAPAPILPSAAMITVPVFAQHDSIVWSQRSPQLTAHPLGTLVGGTKKDVVISNKIRNDLKSGVPRPVVIYGWHQLNGSPIQPLYNGHAETYADYSHGIRLVLDSTEVDGVPRTLSAVLQDPLLSSILSDEGAIRIARYGDAPTGVGELKDERSEGSTMLQTYPNPFNPVTTIQFGLRSASNVRLTIHDLLGRQVQVLVDRNEGPGLHVIRFDGSDLASGMYVCRIVIGSLVASRKIVLAR